MRGVWNCSRLNTPTSSSFHLFVRPTALSCRNFASNQNKSNLGAFAVGVGEFKRVYSPEKFYVDKTSYIPLLEKLDVNAIVSLRPRRFGKTLFADTLAQYYDAFNSPKFNELFGHLSVGKQRTPLANSFLVLPLTFAGLRTETAEEFKMSLNNELNSSASTFKARYNLNFQVNTHDALDTYKLLFDEMRLKQNKVYVIIDEYDASLNKTLGNGSFVSALSYSSEDHQNPLKRMENTYSEFFSKLKTACDIGVARCFITGVTPLVLSEFTSGFNIATHISDISRFSLMYGFTKSDVHNGLKRLDLADPVITAVLEMWKREHDGYYFHPRAEEPLYNPTRILHGLQQIECLKVPDNLSSMELAIRLQEEIPKDSNSKPAESTLQAIREARYAPIVIEKLLAQEDATINIPGGAEEVFRLSHMNELATSPTPLLSFMRYMGALTYVPVNFNDRISYSLRIPNDVARREFTKALQDLLDLDETGKTDLRRAINVLVEKKELSPFCKAVSKHLLSRSNARDVILGEDPFAQAVFDAMVLLRRNSDSVFKEFAFKPDSTPWQRYVDIVYHVHNPPDQDYYHYLSLKSIPVAGLKLSAGETDWNKLCNKSRDTIDKLLPVDIVNLPLAYDYCRRHRLVADCQLTVQYVVDNAVKEVRDLYIPTLRSEHAHFWVLVRVGLQTILLYKVTKDKAELNSTFEL